MTFTLTTHSRVREPRTVRVYVPTAAAAHRALTETWTRSPDLTRAELRDPNGRVIGGGYRMEASQ
jgi:hypothetical protein